MKDAWINSGSGIMDFEKEVRELKPDYFFVNTDGYMPDKKAFCEELGIEQASQVVFCGDSNRPTTTELGQTSHLRFRHGGIDPRAGGAGNNAVRRRSQTLAP